MTTTTGRLYAAAHLEHTYKTAPTNELTYCMEKRTIISDDYATYRKHLQNHLQPYLVVADDAAAEADALWVTAL